MINGIVEKGIKKEPQYKTKKGIVVMREDGNLLYVSGHGPENQITGEPLYRGRVGAELTEEEGHMAARECGIIILGALKDRLGSLDRIEKVIKAFGMVNCDGEFSGVNKVMDGFSDVMTEVLDERGYHARTVMGTHNLPNGNIPVEIEVIVAVRS